MSAFDRAVGVHRGIGGSAQNASGNGPADHGGLDLLAHVFHVGVEVAGVALYIRLAVQLGEVVEHDSEFTPGDALVGVQVGGVQFLRHENVVGLGPRTGVGAVGPGGHVAIAALAAHSGGTGVAIEHGGKLAPLHLGVGAERGGGGAVEQALVHDELDLVAGPVGAGDVGKHRGRKGEREGGKQCQCAG